MSERRDEVPRIRPTVETFVPSDGSDTIVFDDVRRRWHRLPDPTGAIWSAIDGRRTVSKIAEHLAFAYATDADTIAGDVEATVAQLVDLDLVAVSPPS